MGEKLRHQEDEGEFDPQSIEDAKKFKLESLEYAKENFAAELIIADPFSKIETPVFLSGVLKNTGPEFSAAIGLALKKIQ
jgi:hypothetical protein